MSHDAADRLSVDAQDDGLIAHLEGRRPPAPDWFAEALAVTPERRMLTIEGAAIETLAWGPVGAPGLVLLHGNGAHAEWWSPIAPFFAAQRRVVALTWSGMGGSDWRPAYAISTFVAEIRAALAAHGLFDAPRPPTLVGHSFGGFPALAAAGAFGERLAGVVTVDSPIEPPDREEGGPPRRSRPNRLYPSLEAALARFRLAPPQPCDNLYYVDHVARGSIKETPEGFTWRFDPFIWRSFAFERLELAASARCPLAVMWGARSSLMPEPVLAHMRATFPKATPFIEIPEARHHVMLDEPLAFVAALRALLAAWPAR